MVTRRKVKRPNPIPPIHMSPKKDNSISFHSKQTQDRSME
jgi:hypothetical protein